MFGSAGGLLPSLFVPNEEAEVGQKEKEERSEGGEESPTDAIKSLRDSTGRPIRASRIAHCEPPSLCKFRAASRLPRGPPPDAWTQPRRC